MSAGAEDLPEREIPRHDGQHDPEGFVRNVALERLGGDGRIGQVVSRVIGIVVAGERALVDLGLRLDDGLPHL